MSPVSQQPLNVRGCHGATAAGRWHGTQVFVGRMTLPLDPATHLAWLAVISTDRRADGGDDGGGGGGGGPGSLLSFWGLGVAERGLNPCIPWEEGWLS